MQVERPTLGTPVLLTGFVLLPTLPAVWWFAGWEWALAVWVGALTAAGVADWLAAAWRIPSGARAASESALAEFSRLHATDTPLGVAVRAAEPERFVFAVYYQRPGTVTEPPPRRYYAVGRSEPASVVELDERDWPVYGLK